MNSNINILLINPPIRTYTRAQCHPLNMVYLAASLRQKGMEVEILDVNCNRWPIDEVIRYIAKKEFSFIGTGGIITTYKYIKQLSRELKDHYPEIPIIVGGQVASPIAHIIFKQMPVDVVAHSYGEITLPTLLTTLSMGDDLGKVPGITFCKNDKLVNTGPAAVVKNLDELPFPAYDLIDMDQYLEGNPFGGEALNSYLQRNGLSLAYRREILVHVTRGCPHKCTFCIHEKEFPGFKIHSVEYAVKHVKYLHEQYGVNIFKLGEEFVLTKKGRWFKEFLDKVRDEGMTDCFFAPSGRADSITDEMINYYKSRNVYRIGFGFESGDQRMLDSMLKRVTAEQNVQAVNLLKKHGYSCNGTFMVGFPGENLESIENTCKSIKNAQIEIGGIFYATPYPGAILYDWALERGLIRDEDKYLETVSDKDASEMHINLTFYPDFIVRYFLRKVQIAFMKNQKNFDMELSQRLKRSILLSLFPLISLFCQGYLLALKRIGLDPVDLGKTDGVSQMSKHYNTYRQYVNNRN